MSALRGENSELLKLVSRLQASGSNGLEPPARNYAYPPRPNMAPMICPCQPRTKTQVLCSTASIVQCCASDSCG